MKSISRVSGAVVLALAGLLAPPTRSQFQVLFTEDFEDGLQGWSHDGFFTSLWHLAEHGECGVTVTRMAAYSKPEPACSYETSTLLSKTGVLSQSFLLTGSSPFNLSLDGYFSMEGPLVDVEVTLYDVPKQQDAVFAFPAISAALKAQPDTFLHVEGDFTPPPNWSPSDLVKVHIMASSTSAGGRGTGVRVDNLVLRSSAFDQLGGALSGSGSVDPTLVGFGPLTSGSQNSVLLKWVPQGVPAYLVTGFAVLDAPFKGGTMVPYPTLITPVVTGSGAMGITILPFTLPTVPPGFQFYMQYWIQDAGAVHGFSASNGLRGTTS